MKPEIRIIDHKPTTEKELAAKRSILFKQRKKLLNQPIVWVMCPCGSEVPLKMAFRCWFCGITFCDKCAARHFGKKPLMCHLEGSI